MTHPWSAALMPSDMLAVQLQEHAEFCLNPLHKGPCKKTDTPTYKAVQPKLRKVPGAPPDITDQENRGKAINAGLAEARQRAELLADQLGLRGKDRQGAAKAIGDYGRQLHARNTALQAAQRIHDQLQKAHDRAQAQNLQAQLRAKLTNMRRADAARKQLARELARQARGRHHGGKGGGQPSAEAKQIMKSAGYALDLDEIEVPSMFAPLDPDLYALAAVPPEIALYGLDPHAYCGLNEFCRNPLHPGPCKGWKHMLHSVAPGAYHAYEKSRVERLNARRLERIKALQDAGQKVPKHLLKPITYAEVPKLPPGVDYHPPTAKEAEAALPATAKEIGAKIAQKHAQIQAVKVSNAHKALVESALALGANKPSPEAQKLAEEKFHEAAAQLQPGQKLSQHASVAGAINVIAAQAAKKAQLTDEERAALHADLAAHVDQGIAEVPQLVTSAANKAKEIEAQKQADLLVSAKEAEKAVHQDLTAQTLSHLKQSHPALIKSPGSIGMALDKLKKIQEHEHTSEAQKKTAAELTSKYQDAAKVQEGQAKILASAGKMKIGELAPDQHETWTKVLAQIAENPASTPAQVKKAQELGKKFADQAPNAKASEAHTILAKTGMGITEKANQLTKEHFDALPATSQQALLTQLKDVETDAGPQKSKLATELIEKFTGASLAKAPPTMKVGGHEVAGIHDLNKISKAEYDQLEPVDQKKVDMLIKDTLVNHPGTEESGLAKAFKAKFAGTAPKTAAEQAHEDHVAKLLEGVSPAGQEVAGFPPVPSHLSAGAKHAAAVANGTAPGAKLAKTHLSAYSDLTSDEFHELPEPYQKKIAADLDAAHAKFLDPKKKDQVVAIKEQLGIGHPGEAGGGAGAGGGMPPHEQAMHEKAAKQIDTIEAIGKITGGKALEPEIKAQLVGLQAQSVANSTDQQAVFHGSGGSFVDKYFGGLVDLTEKQKADLANQAAQEFKAMYQTGSVVPPAHSLVGKAIQAHDQPASVGTPTLNDLVEHYSPATAEAKVAKQVAAVVALHKHADEELPADVNPAELTKTLNGVSPALGDKVLEGHATQMAENAYLNAVLDMGLNNPQKPETMIPESLKATLLPVLKLNYLNAIKAGKTKPEGIAGFLPEIAAKLSKKDNVTLADFLDEYDKHTLALSNADVVTPAEAKKVAKPAAKATSSAKAGTAKAVKLGGGTKIDHIAVNDKKSLTADFKGMPKGKYLQDPTSDIFDNLVALAAVHGKKPGVGPLSVTQVTKIIDETHAANLHVANSGMLEKKITDWLATGEGKAYAQAHLKPDPAIVKNLTGEIELPKGVKLKPGEKVQTLSGPGAYDTKLKPHDFAPLTMSQAQNSQAQYMKEQGITWSPDSIAALKQYTASQYAYNTYLRGTGYHTDNKTKQQVIDIQHAMMPLQQHTLLKRGTGLDALPPGFQNPEAALTMKGKTFEDPGFGSTTVGGESGHFSTKPLQLTIEAPAGTPAAVINDISHFKGIENEVLLAAGTKFKVISVEKKHGQIHMRVRVVTKK